MFVVGSKNCLLFFLAPLVLLACRDSPKSIPFPPWKIQEKLSAYPFFERIKEGNFPGSHNIANGNQPLISISYDLNSPLFSDFMDKERIVFLPEGTEVNYREDQVFDFPEGTVISKTFRGTVGYNTSLAIQDKRIETRLLLLRSSEWYAVSYVWNDKDTDALVAYGGAQIGMSREKEQFVYSVPSRNQCSQCHQIYEGEKQVLVPIGPRAKQLNKISNFTTDGQNQLSHWKKLGILANLPVFQIPRLTAYMDNSAHVEERARAYLDSNCAHCHRSNASGGINSKLLLNSENKDLLSFGVCKQPGSAGKGGGKQLKFDIVPGKPEESILYYRMVTRDPGAMMPQIGRALSDPIGKDLIGNWIESMPSKDCP